MANLVGRMPIGSVLCLLKFVNKLNYVVIVEVMKRNMDKFNYS